MLQQYIYQETSAEYYKKILLIDDDDLFLKAQLKDVYCSNEFEVIEYINDIDFRIKYENKIKNGDGKYVVIAKSDVYIPYDFLSLFNVADISLKNVFSKLNNSVIRDLSIYELDMLSMVYRSNFDVYSKVDETQRYLDEKVFEVNNIKRYVTYLLEDLITRCQNCNSYTSWFRIAETKAAIDRISIKYNVIADTSKVNTCFQSWVLNNYGTLSSEISKDGPVLVSKAMEYMADQSEKFVIIVMDGMSEFDWNIISQSFKDITFEKTSAFAMIPTITSISRQCLLSNKYPVQLEKPWSQSKEKNEFISCAQELGFQNLQIDYQRGYDVAFSSFIKCGAVIINDVDDIMHGQQQGRNGMLNDMELLSNQSKLSDLVRKLIHQGFDVYVSTDHGNTECIGTGYLRGLGVETETKSRRMVVLKDFADKESIKEKRNLIEFPKYFLMKDYDYLICSAGESFDSNGEKVITHGGITIDEVIVPFIKIKAVNNNG